MSERIDAKTARKHAKDAVRRGDIAAAEKWSKVAERLAALPEETQPEDREALREELRRRLTLFVAADRDIDQWEKEKAIHEAEIEAALANDTEPPPPLRPYPGGELSYEEYLGRIAREGY